MRRYSGTNTILQISRFYILKLYVNKCLFPVDNEEVSTHDKDGATEMLLRSRGGINNSDEDDEVDLFNVMRDR